MKWRRVSSSRQSFKALVLILIALAAIDLRMAYDVVFNPGTLRTDLSKRAERVPGFDEFLEGVRSRTREGDSIALIVGARNPREYGYGLIRASYILAGRPVVRMIAPDGKLRAREIGEARYVAVFGMEYRGAGDVVWRDGRGMLVRQR
jgi:hypothetical protein